MMGIVAIKRRKPSFRRQRGPWSKRLKESWRRPRGQNSKQRKKLRHRGARPCSGYRQPRSVRGLHPSGFPEIIVHNVSELDGLTSVAIRIARTVGRKKRQEIVAKAKELDLKVINP